MQDSPAHDRRNRYRDFDAEPLSDFLGSRTIVAASRISTGKSNTNFKLDLSDGQTVVYRLYSQAGPNSPQREATIQRLIGDRVPVPATLDHGDDWTVFEFVNGETLDTSPQDSGAAAAALAHLSEVTFDTGGWIQADGTVTPFDFGDDFVESILDDPDVLQWIGADTARDIRQILQSESARLAEIRSQHVLVHGDFNPTNILVHNGAVTAVLDWEYAHSGTPYMDIGNLLRNTDPRFHDDIGRGLASGGMPLPDDWKERAALVDLGSHIEFLTSTRSDEFKRSRVDLINEFARLFSAT